MLDTILQNFQTQENPTKQGCLCTSQWLDPFGNWHCQTCDPPPYRSAVKSTRTLDMDTGRAKIIFENAAQRNNFENRQADNLQGQKETLRVICGPCFERIIILNENLDANCCTRDWNRPGESFDEWCDRGANPKTLEFAISAIEKFGASRGQSGDFPPRPADNPPDSGSVK